MQQAQATSTISLTPPEVSWLAAKKAFAVQPQSPLKDFLVEAPKPGPKTKAVFDSLQKKGFLSFKAEGEMAKIRFSPQLHSLQLLGFAAGFLRRTRIRPGQNTEVLQLVVSQDLAAMAAMQGDQLHLSAPQSQRAWAAQLFQDVAQSMAPKTRDQAVLPAMALQAIEQIWAGQTSDRPTARSTAEARLSKEMKKGNPKKFLDVLVQEGIFASQGASLQIAPKYVEAAQSVLDGEILQFEQTYLDANGAAVRPKRLRFVGREGRRRLLVRETYGRLEAAGKVPNLAQTRLSPQKAAGIRESFFDVLYVPEPAALAKSISGLFGIEF